MEGECCSIMLPPSSVDHKKRHIIDPNMISTVPPDAAFRRRLRADIAIPSYIHTLSIGLEYIYDYVLNRIDPRRDYFKTVHILGKHAFADARRYEIGEYAKREMPALSISQALQYDFNDNLLDYEYTGINQYLRRSAFDRSFFKDHVHGIYLGINFEAVLVNYNFKFRVETRAEQIDLFNRIRKILRLGCTETNDIDVDYHIDYHLMTQMAIYAGFAVDTNGTIVDVEGFTKYLNRYSQYPILYKLRLINQKHEFFLRMRNMPIHIDLTDPLDASDPEQSGHLTSVADIDLQLAVRIPSVKAYALYNEGKVPTTIRVESPTENHHNIYSIKVFDIPEVNYKGWPMYGHCDYVSDEPGKPVKEIEIKDLFKAPVNSMVGTDLEALICESLDRFISPEAFIDIAVYTSDPLLSKDGRLPITMDWENRKILLPDGIPDSYFYLAIYIDREYVNQRVTIISRAMKNRVHRSPDMYGTIEKHVQDGFDYHKHIEPKDGNVTPTFPPEVN